MAGTISRRLHCALAVGLAVAAVVGLDSASVPVAFNTEGRFGRGVAPKVTPSLLVPVYQGLSLVRERKIGTELMEPVMLLQEEMEKLKMEGLEEPVWLGSPTSGTLKELQEKYVGNSEDGFWMLDLSTLPEAPSSTTLGVPGARWAKLRDRNAAPSVCDLLEDDHAALLAVAAGLSNWHRSVRFCAKCGGPTESFRSGSNRRCSACGSRFRPRVDPAMIVLVTSGRRCLLGRKASWPPGRFSALAGFVEFGETLEECVRREVREESGVVVDDHSIRFVASQPWLFPRSLLLGFTAEAADDTIDVDQDELEEVKWFEASYLRRQLLSADKDSADDFNIPSKTSLAHSLIKGWLHEVES